MPVKAAIFTVSMGIILLKILYLHCDFTAVLKSDHHFAFGVDSHQIDGSKPEFLVKLSKQLIMAFHLIKEAYYLLPLGGALQHFIVLPGRMSGVRRCVG